jgi:hypothetical protein
MKSYKVIKSVDYTVYPIYKEIVKINDSIKDTIAGYVQIIVSAIACVAFEKTIISTSILECIRKAFPQSVFVSVTKQENASLVISVLLALLVLIILKAFRFLRIRWSNNKNTKAKRDIIVRDFYHIAIPQLVEIKGMIEKSDLMKSQQIEGKKRLLLLLQAFYEIMELNTLLQNMKVIERKNGEKRESSTILLSRIGERTYITFCQEMLYCLVDLYNKLKEETNTEIELDHIKTIINEGGIFSEIDEVEDDLNEYMEKLGLS